MFTHQVGGYQVASFCSYDRFTFAVVILMSSHHFCKRQTTFDFLNAPHLQECLDIILSISFNLNGEIAFELFFGMVFGALSLRLLIVLSKTFNLNERISPSPIYHPQSTFSRFPIPHPPSPIPHSPSPIPHPPFPIPHPPSPMPHPTSPIPHPLSPIPHLPSPIPTPIFRVLEFGIVLSKTFNLNERMY
uniref:Uncharacterized protein n=1 Tax=Amphimedon queenslandica TaxID=400682 RepID=A0A1X7TD61_AMPQE